MLDLIDQNEKSAKYSIYLSLFIAVAYKNKSFLQSYRNRQT
jgi:hypothetical protein